MVTPRKRSYPSGLQWQITHSDPPVPTLHSKQPQSSRNGSPCGFDRRWHEPSRCCGTGGVMSEEYEGWLMERISHRYIYIYIYIYVRIYTNIQIFRQTSVLTYVQDHTWSYMMNHTCMNTWIHECIYIPILAWYSSPFHHIYANKNDNDSAGFLISDWIAKNSRVLTPGIQQPCEVFKENKHVIFTGNGYSAEWPIEANKRGLPNLNTTPKAIATWNSEKNKTLGQIAMLDVAILCSIWCFGHSFHSVKPHQVSSDVVLHSRLQDQIFALSLHNLAVFHIHRHLQASLNSTADIRWMVEGMLADFDMFRKETVGDPKDLHSRGDWGTSGSDVWKLYLFNVLWSLPCLHASFCLCLTIVVVFVACWLWFPLKGSLLCLGSNIFCLVQGQVTSTGNKQNITKFTKSTHNNTETST